MVAGRILPAVAFSILFGNLFYAWQAHRLARRTGRNDVTAIPFGINTPTIFAYISLIMVPVYLRTHDATLAWHMGIFASLLSGVVQTVSAFCIDWLRRTTPLAALLSPLAGLAMAFLCLGFVFGIFENPAVALLPAVIILATYASRMRLPLRIPSGFVAMVVGALTVVVLKAFHLYHLPAQQPLLPLGLYLPKPVNLFHVLTYGDGWRYASIFVPLSLLDTIVSLQILESVRLDGDDYATTPSLLVNGLATLAGTALGSAFPTSLYIGHNAHKANGARIGYSILGGIASAALCLSGLVPAVLHVVPLEVVAFAVVWFGLAMVGQAFAEVPAVALRCRSFGTGADAGAVGDANGGPGGPQIGRRPDDRRSALRQRAGDLRIDRAGPGRAARVHDMGGGPGLDDRTPVPASGDVDAGRCGVFVLRPDPCVPAERAGHRE